MDCLFCSIIDRKIPASIVHENDHILVIKDIKPAAPIHYLILPKKHYKDLRDIPSDDIGCMEDILAAAQYLSSQNIQAHDFRLVVNNGAQAGQIIFHLHVHFLAGFTAKESINS